MRMMKMQAIGSKARKQRKMLFQAPDHKRAKIFTAPLSPELKASQGIKNLPARTGDTVRVTRGEHKGFEGKISRVDRANYRVYVEGLTREKVDGTTIFLPVHPSKMIITNLNLDDKWRKKILERKKKGRGKVAKPEEKPAGKRKKVAEKEVKLKLPEEKPVKEEIVMEKPRRARTTRKASPRKTKKETEKEEPEGETKGKDEEKKPRAKKSAGRRKKTDKTEGET